ncbi:hypothetical protein Hanom_Chr08g00710811 [Helianthus anomalus]
MLPGPPRSLTRLQCCPSSTIKYPFFYERTVSWWSVMVMLRLEEEGGGCWSFDLFVKIFLNIWLERLTILPLCYLI